MPLTANEIRNRVYPHAGKNASGDQVVELISNMREEFHKFMAYLNAELPDGRYKSLAITTLEETQTWANKALAEGAPIVQQY